MIFSRPMKHFLKMWLPPIILDRVRAISKTKLRSIQNQGMKEFDCLDLRWRLDMGSSISRSMVTKGVWEPDTTSVVLDFVKPGMKVLSIGANFGYYAMLMAHRVGREGHVWAFEPTLKFREQLNWHINENHLTDRVTIVPFGLSDSIKTVMIDIMAQSASLHFPPELPRIGSEMVELKPLDVVVPELGIDRVDFIQMDIDGHEAAFLRGAEETLRNNFPPIAMEFSQSCLHFAGSDVREVAALLTQIGYQVCSEKTRKPYQTESEFLLDCGNFDRYSNALAMPRRRKL